MTAVATLAAAPVEGVTSVLSIAIRERAALYGAYMPGLKGGGLFVPTNRSFRLGDEIRMLVSLPNESDKITVNGRVAWLTPPECQSRKVAGIGVLFNDDDDGRAAKRQIESILGPTGTALRPTHTF